MVSLSDSFFSKLTAKVTLPFSVYLTALVSIFVMTCLILTSSPSRLFGISLSISSFSASPLSSALVRIILTRSLITEESSYSTGIISILPASILEKSSISLTNPSRLEPAVLILEAYVRISSSSHSLSIISFIPSTALIGVRISWDMFDKNADLASFAATARSDTSISLSLSFLSSDTQRIRAIFPSSSLLDTMIRPRLHFLSGLMTSLVHISASRILLSMVLRFVDSMRSSSIHEASTVLWITVLTIC